MRTKPVVFQVGRNTLRRNEHWQWSRLRLPEEMSGHSCFPEFGLTPFEEALVEDVLQTQRENNNANLV